MVLLPYGELGNKALYSSSEDLNLIKLTPFGRSILNVGFLSFDKSVKFLWVILICSTTTSGSSTSWPQIDFKAAIPKRVAVFIFLWYNVNDKWNFAR